MPNFSTELRRPTTDDLGLARDCLQIAKNAVAFMHQVIAGQAYVSDELVESMWSFASEPIGSQLVICKYTQDAMTMGKDPLGRTRLVRREPSSGKAVLSASGLDVHHLRTLMHILRAKDHDAWLVLPDGTVEASSQEQGPVNAQLWIRISETGRESLLDSAPAEQLRPILKRYTAECRDVWLIHPDGTKELPDGTIKLKV